MSQSFDNFFFVITAIKIKFHIEIFPRTALSNNVHVGTSRFTLVRNEMFETFNIYKFV